MIGAVILIVYLAGLLPIWFVCARGVYKEMRSSYRDGRDGEAMIFATLLAICGAGLWPIVVVGYLIYRVFQAGLLDVIFMDRQERNEILRNERDERIRELERQVSMSPDQIYRRQEVINRLPAKYRRVQ